ncbi:ribosome-associated translation inhibitor RaiA [Fodinicola feengrottensis]|uniref:Ribosome hibernation promoting factor n=1 Tax=Fodinicola feengrottensis TaxID=435914 RepID=A0ABN2GEW5_9ACTN
MDIVVKGRNVEVPDHYRQHASDKLEKVGRYDHKLIRIDVELFHEPNRRQAASCQRVEITVKSRGPVVRSEACAGDFYSALDSAIGKLEGRLRRSADRRRVHRGLRRPTSVAEATAGIEARVGQSLAGLEQNTDLQPSGNGTAVTSAVMDLTDDELELEHIGDGPGRIVREKEHGADPMTIDQALFEMELVGHDFFLFHDKDSGRPSVVYRRKGYDYGVIRLVEAMSYADAASAVGAARM